MANKIYQLIRHDGNIIPVGQQGVSLGRSSTNAVLIPDPKVSRQHARILLAADRCWIRDENSALGTYINGIRVPGQQEFKPGDVLKIGNTTFRLVFSQGQDREHLLEQSISTRAPGAEFDLKKLLPVLIGGGLILILAGVALFSGGGFFSSPGNSPFNGSSGAPAVEVDPWVAAVEDSLSILGQNPDFEDNLLAYQKTGLELEKYLVFEAEIREVTAVIDQLKSTNIPGVGNAWNVLVDTADTAYPGTGNALETIGTLLRTLQVAIDSLSALDDLTETRVTSRLYRELPSREKLLMLDQTLPSSIAVLKSIVSNINELQSETDQYLDAAEAVLDAMDSFSMGFNIPLLSELTQSVRGLTQPVKDLDRYLSGIESSLEGDLEVMEIIHSKVTTAQNR